MNIDEITQRANDSTPPHVEIPAGWPGLIVWAIGKFGVGVIFLMMLVYVYQDMQAQSRSMVEVVKANAVAIEALANRTEQMNQKVDRIENDLRHERSTVRNP